MYTRLILVTYTVWVLYIHFNNLFFFFIYVPCAKVGVFFSLPNIWYLHKNIHEILFRLIGLSSIIKANVYRRGHIDRCVTYHNFGDVLAPSRNGTTLCGRVCFMKKMKPEESVLQSIVSFGFVRTFLLHLIKIKITKSTIVICVI